MDIEIIAGAFGIGTISVVGYAVVKAVKENRARKAKECVVAKEAEKVANIVEPIKHVAYTSHAITPGMIGAGAGFAATGAFLAETAYRAKSTQSHIATKNVLKHPYKSTSDEDEPYDNSSSLLNTIVAAEVISNLMDTTPSTDNTPSTDFSGFGGGSSDGGGASSSWGDSSSSSCDTSSSYDSSSSCDTSSSSDFSSSSW